MQANSVLDWCSVAIAAAAAGAVVMLLALGRGVMVAVLLIKLGSFGPVVVLLVTLKTCLFALSALPASPAGSLVLGPGLFFLPGELDTLGNLLLDAKSSVSTQEIAFALSCFELDVAHILVVVLIVVLVPAVTVVVVVMMMIIVGVGNLIGDNRDEFVVVRDFRNVGYVRDFRNMRYVRDLRDVNVVVIMIVVRVIMYRLFFGKLPEEVIVIEVILSDHGRGGT